MLLLFEGGGVTTAAARAAADEPGLLAALPSCMGFGDSIAGLDSRLLASSGGRLFSLQSFGRRDSVEPLFLIERGAVGRSSSNRASSICRRAIWPSSSSRRLFQLGTDVQRVLRASMVEYAAISKSGRVPAMLRTTDRSNTRRVSWVRDTKQL